MVDPDPLQFLEPRRHVRPDQSDRDPAERRSRRSARSASTCRRCSAWATTPPYFHNGFGADARGGVRDAPPAGRRHHRRSGPGAATCSPSSRRSTAARRSSARTPTTSTIRPSSARNNHPITRDGPPRSLPNDRGGEGTECVASSKRARMPVRTVRRSNPMGAVRESHLTRDFG